MKIEHKEVIVETKMIQVTTTDERWYTKDFKSFVPSVTWIAGCYPKGVQFYKWLAENGWDEAEAIKREAGDKGSKVHACISDLLKGKKINISDKYMNNSKVVEEELTVAEWECVMSFANWFQETKPEVVAFDITVWYDDLLEGGIKFAGSIDLVCRIDGKLTIVDFKTSQSVWKSMEVQLIGYAMAYNDPIDSLAVLQVGYKRNKNGYKFTEITKDPSLFKAAYRIWQEENGDEKPKQREYPMSLQILEPIIPEEQLDIETEIKKKK